uniref:Uncharacterized protein n=1 Tax=Entomoneis paludosa TaxID=265537 RepID=A0A7S2V7N2_9STRA|mmetsp:Transcript_11179/g.22886  ORF Transcript_11179/g.22886 Transcript_11179/m.22886 type:complete len:337 (+) Transcript_11179:76-1086(+)
MNMTSSTHQQQQQHVGPQSVFCKPISSRSPKDEDTEALAGFLLSLKHRSVTPEPHHPLNDPVSPRADETSQPDMSHYPTSDSRTQSPFQNVSASSSTVTETTPPQSPVVSSSSSALQDSEIDLEALIGDSKLVLMKDRDLVPDPLFAAMAQMKPCRLQHADRVGCYKNRELGFVGMCCMHCGGQPGFGRYYPNSVRSLAQTTTSQTILKHIGGKCRFAPPEIREAILELQRQQAVREGLPTGRPRYGSRKIFFQRVWQRLHDLDVEEGSEAQGSISASSSKASDEEMASLHSEDEEVCAANGKRKSDASFEGSMPYRKRAKSHDSQDSFPTQVSNV